MRKTRAGKNKPRPLPRSSPRKRGSRLIHAAGGKTVLDSGSRGNERREFARVETSGSVGAPPLEAAALYRLMAFLSPSYPIGAFSYSGGIEWAVEAGDIRDAASLQDWLSLVIEHGSGFCDAVFFAHAHRAAGDPAALAAIAEFATAFASSKERYLETIAQGRAFLDTTRAAWPCATLEALAALPEIALPVAVAVACSGHGIPLGAALTAFLHAQAAAWISAGVRLIPLGQTDGQRILAALETAVEATAGRALVTPLDDIGSAAFRADIASMRHETQYTRLFRS
jgi:urease accessory protein